MTQVINFAVIPFVALGLGMFFKNNPYMALGMLLADLVPTRDMIISWTCFAKGNMDAAVKMTVIGLAYMIRGNWRKPSWEVLQAVLYENAKNRFW